MSVSRGRKARDYSTFSRFKLVVYPGAGVPCVAWGELCVMHPRGWYVINGVLCDQRGGCCDQIGAVHGAACDQDGAAYSRKHRVAKGVL